jgi:diguanylate cyclase (GGDEF)-like protein
VRRVFGFKRLPGTDAHLAVGVSEAAILARVDHEIWIAYVELGTIALVVLFGIWFGSERLIVRPIRSLTRTAGQLGRGHLEARAGRNSWAPEFAPLAAALNDMAQRLAAREEELRIANTHLEELARLDGLSGLTNRRGFDAALEAEWQRAAKLQQPLALLMIDVDHFKLFNDSNGHVEGDECLRALGEIIGVAASRGAYVPARYGGEEFALLLPGLDARAGREVAESVREAMADLGIPHPAAPSGRVTVSIGVAALVPAPGESAQALIEAADAALYAAKRRGRNAVVGHEEALLPLAS